MPVYAQDYTEYEFVGYQENIPIVDEFTKYEPVTLHKYYSLKESTTQELDKYDTQREDFDICEPQPIKEIISNTPDDNYENERFIVLRTFENDVVNRLKIENFNNIKFSKITIKDGEKTISMLDNLEGLTAIDVNLPNITIDDLEITIYYEGAGTSNYATVSLEGESGTIISILTTIESKYTKSIIKPMSLELVTKKGLYNQKLQYHYRYYRETYSCINYLREYYDTLEVDNLDGYMYDSQEDKTVYKVYRREKIPTQIEETDKDESEKSESKESEESNNILPPSMEPPKVDKIPVISSTIVSNKNANYSSAKNVEDKESEEIVTDVTDVNDKNYDRIALLEKEVTSLKSDNSQVCCDTTNYTDSLKELKLLILILIILTILHTIQLLYVNKNN